MSSDEELTVNKNTVDSDDEEIASPKSAGNEEVEEQEEEEGQKETHKSAKRILISDDEDDELEEKKDSDGKAERKEDSDGQAEEKADSDHGRKPRSLVDSDDEPEKKNDSDDEPVANKANDDSDDEELTITKEKKKKDHEDLFGSSSDSDSDDDEQTKQLMDGIFGEENEEDKEKKEGASSDDDEEDRKAIREREREREERSDDDDDRPRHRWDFDEMMDRKRAERRKSRKSRKRDGGIDLISDSDDQIKALVDQMARAANADRNSNEARQPAIQKQKLLPAVKKVLVKMDWFEALLDNGMMSAISDWLAPLPDKSLPSLDVRTTLLKILESYPRLEQGILRQSGLGKAVMLLLKHPKEIKENKVKAAKLIRDWSRPIFQLDTNYNSMTREERYELDYIQASGSKKRKESADEAGPSKKRANNNDFDDFEAESAGGPESGISRARVPRPSMKAYVNRPKSNVEGTFHGASKSRGTARFDMAHREFKERTKTAKAKRHVAVSIEGRRMDI